MTEKTVKLDPKEVRELERIGAARGVTVHALMRQFIRWGIRAVTGTLEDEIDLERQRLDLEARRAQVLQTAITKNREKARQELSPLQAIVSAFNTGDGEGALAHFKELTPRVQNNVLRQLQKEAPQIAKQLQPGE